MLQSTSSKWTVNLLVPLAIYLFGPSLGLDHKMVLFLTITVWGVLGWVLESLPDNLIAILLPAFYVAFHLGTGKQILAPWTSSLPWVLLGGMMMGMIMMQTGLAKRIALISIRLSGFSFTKAMIGLVLAGFIIGPFVPSVIGKGTILAVICLGICDALQLKKGSREGATVLLVGFIAVACSKLAYLTGGGDVIMAASIAGQSMAVPITWSNYFLHNFPLAVLYAAISLITILLVMRPKLSTDLKDYINQEYQALGKTKPDEYKSLAIMVIMLILMATTKYHGLNSGLVLIFMGSTCFLPGMNLLNTEKLAKMNFGVIFFVLGCLCIGAGAKAAGLSSGIQELIIPHLTGGQTSTLTAIFSVGVFANYVLTPLAAVATLTGPMVDICTNFGLSPATAAYSLLYGLDQYIFPYEFAVLLYFFSFGYIKVKHVIMVFAIRTVLAFIFFILAAVPYWNLIGA
ncbi:SLC13 family permease [Desulfovibrio sp. UCD-KL4C]|uniref:SLC13 family permease n=1 Tax=Desulfovibrio sp. UCD-KL4C TaxID=2578120 RepID=UPI0025BCAB5B|nr:SLC13 family permease [Desulfovibrio sp. UCD-KL4C]